LSWNVLYCTVGSRTKNNLTYVIIAVSQNSYFVRLNWLIKITHKHFFILLGGARSLRSRWVAGDAWSWVCHQSWWRYYHTHTIYYAMLAYYIHSSPISFIHIRGISRYQYYYNLFHYSSPYRMSKQLWYASLLR